MSFSAEYIVHVKSSESRAEFLWIVFSNFAWTLLVRAAFELLFRIAAEPEWPSSWGA
jgi:hypothetical protein